MSFALTENSKLVCAHQGVVQLKAGQSKLTVGGAKVLVDGDLTKAPISLCTTLPDPNTSTLKCLMISSAINGVATKLKVQGKGVLLEDINGQTNGTVSGTLQTWSVQTAGETELKAI